jgi:hypothetical protein
MSSNKKIMCSFLVVTSAMVSAMEEQLQKSQELKTSQSLEIIHKSCSEDSPPYTFSFSLPTVTGAVSSLAATYNNYMYNTEAFKKVGWPTTDKIAQQELEKSQEIYKRALQNSGSRDDYAFINRRQAICQRVLDELPDHPQGLQLALFCLTHHRAVMTPVDMTRFLDFVQEQQEKSKKADVEFSRLTILPEEDNQLLKNLLKQTLVVKKYPNEEEKKRKEEEEKHRKEEEEKKRIEEEERKRKEEEEKKKKDEEEETRKKEEEDKKAKVEKKNGKK